MLLTAFGGFQALVQIKHIRDNGAFLNIPWRPPDDPSPFWRALMVSALIACIGIVLIAAAVRRR